MRGRIRCREVPTVVSGAHYWMSNMHCRGETTKGYQCRKKATANGYCHVHGGLKKKSSPRRPRHVITEYERQEEIERIKNQVMWAIMIVVGAIALLYGLATGDWEGVANWMGN